MTDNETREDFFNDLSVVQNRAIRILLTKGSIRQTLAYTGVSKATLYRWFQDERFCAVLRHYTDAILNNVSRQLVLASEEAVKVMTDALHDPHASTATKLRAADMVLGHMTRILALTDLNARLTALEELEEGTINATPIYATEAPRATAGRAA